MECIVAGHMAVTAVEITELVPAVDLDLFIGPNAESTSDRAARLDAARDILADLRESDSEAAAYAAALMHARRLLVRSAQRRSRQSGVAA
ncbi:hypothetical protein SLUN_19430 [Streptomyces lunaelactis]|uniref:Uncharacterized protein n=1 Tax=Streptomyces lunaelactis TaxID=1535768 RepID=A0A2R4T4C9_9ACTN|nr:hypothetical protein [Streptomyces lunaelactis]AVZ74009.1 hypothetical protein SLUN_19430 [Streptomyces lunaelactis]NUK85185.1 hypothetical protein [Streptomyces lunaelactis]